MRNCTVTDTNLTDHSQEINKSFIDLYFAMYMDGEWGVTVGYVPDDPYMVETEQTLLDWQLQSDCCLSARASIQPQGFTITQYAALPSTISSCSPFQPLSAGNCYRGCSTI